MRRRIGQGRARQGRAGEGGKGKGGEERRGDGRAGCRTELKIYILSCTTLSSRDTMYGTTFRTREIWTCCSESRDDQRSGTPLI